MMAQFGQLLLRLAPFVVDAMVSNRVRSEADRYKSTFDLADLTSKIRANDKTPDPTVGSGLSQVVSNSGVSEMNVSHASKQQLLDTIGSVADNAINYGISDGELLMALAKNRSTFSPFSLFCKGWGGMMTVLGTTLTSVISLLGLVCLISWVYKEGNNLLEKINKFRESNPWLFWGGAALAAGTTATALTMRDAEEQMCKKDSVLSAQGIEAILGMFVPGFLFNFIRESFSFDMEADEYVDATAQRAVLSALRGDELTADELGAIADLTGASYDDVVAAYDEE